MTINNNGCLRREKKRLVCIVGQLNGQYERGYEERGFRRATGNTVIEFIGQTN